MIPNTPGQNIGRLNFCLILFSTAIIGLRMYVRRFMVKSVGLDDLLAVLAWVGCLSPWLHAGINSPLGSDHGPVSAGDAR